MSAQVTSIRVRLFWWAVMLNHWLFSPWPQAGDGLAAGEGHGHASQLWTGTRAHGSALKRAGK
jgi:hypothetical protein